MIEQAYLFNIGKNYQTYKILGAFAIRKQEEIIGFHFAVWAPNAKRISVIGDFNEWDARIDEMQLVGETGIWVCDIPEALCWDRYKYQIWGKDGRIYQKSDPFARHSETRPANASICYDADDYIWNDEAYLQEIPDADIARPVNIYEVHLGSWRRYEDGNMMNYRQIAVDLTQYCKEMGYTHVELLPIMEHPLDASWGYQIIGYYAVTSRFGTPADFKYMIDYLHQAGIGIILDWVPAHFPKNEEGLIRFDGSPCYEYADVRLGEHREWGTMVFNFAKAEVQSFLISNVMFWLKEFHVDGLRIDAVSSMLYRDYARTEFLPNISGGRENLEVVSFFRALNRLVKEHFPYAYMMAEESTDWHAVTGFEHDSSLGFTHKWNMGWMHDTLDFFSTDYFARGWRKDQFSFSMMYAFSERFALPLSHDEVVHGKKSMIDKMPGDNWRKFASLRSLYLYMIAHPGNKLMFMGSEFGQFIEWREYEELEWFLLEFESHRLIKDFVSKLNHFYIEHHALWLQDSSWEGFSWLDMETKGENCIFAFQRMGKTTTDKVLAVLNMIPDPVHEYRLPVEDAGLYRIELNSDDMQFGGSGYPTIENESNKTVFMAKKGPWKDKPYYIELCLPPLCGLYIMPLKKEDERMVKKEKKQTVKSKTGKKNAKK